MADNSEGLARSAANYVPEQMQTFFNSYQDLFKSAMENATRLQVGAQSSQPQMEYASKLMEAYQMAFQATVEYIEKCAAQSLTGLQSATQIATDRLLQQQETTRNR